MYFWLRTAYLYMPKLSWTGDRLSRRSCGSIRKDTMHSSQPPTFVPANGGKGCFSFPLDRHGRGPHPRQQHVQMHDKHRTAPHLILTPTYVIRPEKAQPSQELEPPCSNPFVSRLLFCFCSCSCSCSVVSCHRTHPISLFPAAYDIRATTAVCETQRRD
ncbi:hypothetical protein BS50DRAFT_331274 [Corynespora cassiicola Philippines]|uniref:Uncharacterized protein n=1 Tax=Corynespora cassiicola Philippines TaxID=1448308 RepID=A0A2T2NUH6_CORCC|nr:hypothetical protein BS50DRAFT_331274 [Corynespora cassiicola Philippines]